MNTFNYAAVKDLIRCPKSQAELVYTGEALVGCDPVSRLRYPIVDGFPVLLIDEAVALNEDDWSAEMRRQGRDPATGRPHEPAPPKG